MSAKPIVSPHATSHSDARSYITGFILSFALTITAYIFAVRQSLPRNDLLIILALLALAQFTVQLLFFFHMAREDKPRWHAKVFGFMAFILIILVAGSIWIMSNLNYRAMTPGQVNQYLHNHEGL